MADSGFPDIEAERGVFVENERRVATSDLFRSASTPDLATTISAVAELYPDIAPAVIIGGALSGISPYDEFWGELGTRSIEDRDDRWANSNFAPLDYVLDLAQGTYGMLRGSARGGMILFETLWEELLPRATRTGVLAYQGMQRGQSLSLSSVWEDYGEASASSGWRAYGVGGEFVGDAFGNVGSVLADYGNLLLPFADPFEVSTESRVNMGSGYFANSELVEADDYRVQQLVRRGYTESDAVIELTDELYGSPSTRLFRDGADAVRITGRGGTQTGVSPGRLAAMAVTEPGTAQYDILSGTMDLGAQIFLDPSNWIGGWMGKARLASRGMRAFDQAPGLINGIRKTVSISDVHKSLASQRGRGMLDYLSNTNDYALIDSIISPATATGKANNSLIREIQSISDPNKMYETILRATTQADIVRKPWKYSATSHLLGGAAAGGTVRGRLLRNISPALNEVNQAVAAIRKNKVSEFAQYRGFQPNFRAKYLDGTIIHDAVTGRISRGHGGRNQRATGRLFSQMIGARIDVSNVSKGIREWRDIARNLDLNPEETQKLLGEAVELLDDDLLGTVRVLETAMEMYRGKLRTAGISDDVINKMTTVYKDQIEMRKYFVNAAGDDETIGTFALLMGNGESIMIPTAQTVAELSDNFLSIPSSPRAIRRMTDYMKRAEGARVGVPSRIIRGGPKDAPIRSIFYNAEFESKVITRSADVLMQRVWKPMVLLRPAWTIRVVGEEMARMSIAGVASFNHPARAFVLALTDKNFKLGLSTRKKLYSSDVYGDAMSIGTEFQAAMSRGAGAWFDGPGGYGANKWIKVSLESKDYNKWWFREMNQLQADRTSKDIAKMLSDPDDPRTIKQVAESFFDGDLAPAREQLMSSSSSMRHRQLNTLEGSEAYVQSIEARLHLKTGGGYEVLKDDGWWYTDAGERLRRETTSPGIRPDLPTKVRGQSAGVRVNNRTLKEYEDSLRRSGKTEKEVQEQMRDLSAAGVVDNSSFLRLDADARTVLMPENKIRQTDILAESHVIEYKITKTGNEELIEAIATGNLRGVDFSGSITGKIEKQIRLELSNMQVAGDVNAPAFVKGVQEADTGMLEKGMDYAFDMFMGKQTNRYSRSPVFMRSYWNSVADLAERGLIDPATMSKLEKMLSGGGKTVQTQAVRKALRHTEKMDEMVSKVERNYVELEMAFNKIDPALSSAMEPTMTRLKKLVEGDHYDVGRYNRIVDDMKVDLKDMQEGLVDSLKGVMSDTAADIAARDDLIDVLQVQIRQMEESIRDLTRLGDEARKAGTLDDLDRMYEAMGKMPEQYIDGLVPHPKGDASGDLTDAMLDRVDELRREAAVEATSTIGVTAAHVGGEPLPPFKTKVVSGGNWTADSPWGEVKFVRTKVKGKKAEWRIELPKGMPESKLSPVPGQAYTTKARAEGALRAHWEELGTSKVYETRPVTLAGEQPPKLPAQGVDVGVPTLPDTPRFRQGARKRAEPEAPRAQFTEEEIKKLRADLGATEEQIQVMQEARFAESDEMALALRQQQEGQAFYDVLPERETGFRSMAEVDSYAKAFALTETQALLYDQGKRSNFSDMFRNIFPFAEAWWEIVSTWTRLIQGNPRALQRFQQAYKGLSEDVKLPEGAYNIEGHDGQGFFFVDPRTDQEMFAIPYLSQALQGSGTAGAVIGGAIGGAIGGIFGGGYGRGPVSAAIGAGVGAAAGFGASQANLVPEGESVELAFSTQGINMATSSVIPGISPLAAVPISWVIDQTPPAVQKPLNDLLMPFGEPEVKGIGGLLDDALPSYVKRFIQAASGGDADLERIRANTTMEVAAMMVRRGEGSFSSPEEIQDTLDRASRKTGWLYAIRGLAAFAGPTAPTFKYSSETDENGAWFYTNTMVEKWRETVEAHNGDTVSAFDEFTGMYGLSPQTYMVGKTKTIRPHPLTEKAYAWKLENEDVYRKFPGTANLLNPTNTDHDDFSYPAYVDSLRSGARAAYAPKEWAEKSNQLAANIILQRFTRSADAFLAGSNNVSVDRLQVDEQMNRLKYTLMKDYPGYSRQIMGTTVAISDDEQYAEIEGWTPRMKRSEMGQPIMSYMAARKEAQALGLARGASKDWWLTSTDGAQVREDVMGIATTLRMANPSFRWAWTSLFSQELSAYRKER